MSTKTRAAGLLFATGLLVVAGLLRLGSRDRPPATLAADVGTLPEVEPGKAGAGPLELPRDLAEHQKPILPALKEVLSDEQALSSSYPRTKASGQDAAMLLTAYVPSEEIQGAEDAVRAAYALGWSLGTVAAHCREEGVGDPECLALAEGWLEANRWPGLLPR